jgi:integrase
VTAGSESGKLMTPCGRVTLRPPVPGAKKAYWNLEWYENDERRQTSGGRTQATAEDKARKVLRNLELDAQPESHERLEVAIAGYLRHLDATASITHTNNTRGELRRALGNIDTKRCESLTKADLRKSLNTARTKDAARVRRTALRGLIGWGLKQGYFSAEQHSAVRDIEWTPPLDAPKRPSRREGARQSNESERFVLASEIPSLDAIAGLAHGFDLRLPETGELLVQFDCSSGLRLGELFAVTADDIDLDRRWVTVERQILSESGLEDRRALP